jgi:hypothetical protein
VGLFLDIHGATLGALAVFLLAACCVFTWYLTVQRLLRYYTPIPDFDYWVTAARLPQYQAFDARVLWHQHNEHRIPFPEMIFAADYLLFHGRRLLPLSLSFLFYLGNWLVVAWAFWFGGPMPPFLRAIGTLLAGIVIGWEGSAVVLASPFLVQWSLTQVTALLALGFLTQLKVSGRKSHLILVIFFAVIATYSSGNGLMLWPILIGAGFILSIRRGEMIALVCAGALAIGAYFIGYKSMGTLSIGNLIRHPMYLLEFVSSYLSMPFGVVNPAWFGVCLGAASLCIVAVLAVVATRTHLVHSRPGIVLFGFYLFMVLTGVLIAAGRMDPADPNFAGAKPQRYLMGPLAAWGVVILLCLWVSSRLARRAVVPYGIAVLLSALLVTALPKLGPWVRERDESFVNLQLAAIAVDMNLFDPGIMRNLFPWNPDYVQLCSKGLRENHLSVFYKGHSKWLGRPIQSFAAPADVTVPGAITYTFPVLNGIEVAGWADESWLRGNTGWVLFANETGKIVGFGRKLPAGFPEALTNSHTPSSLGWAGFVSLRYPVKKVTAYIVNRRGLLTIKGEMPVPPVAVFRRK